MEILKIDDKWSVEYDPENNDRPARVLRYGEDVSHAISPHREWTNDVRAMFHALLAARERIVELERALTPLAKVAAVFGPGRMGGVNWADDDIIHGWDTSYTGPVSLTIGDARNAARLLGMES